MSWKNISTKNSCQPFTNGHVAVILCLINQQDRGQPCAGINRLQSRYLIKHLRTFAAVTNRRDQL